MKPMQLQLFVTKYIDLQRLFICQDQLYMGKFGSSFKELTHDLLVYF